VLSTEFFVLVWVSRWACGGVLEGCCFFLGLTDYYTPSLSRGVVIYISHLSESLLINMKMCYNPHYHRKIERNVALLLLSWVNRERLVFIYISARK
jgi:hypothetical protein